MAVNPEESPHRALSRAEMRILRILQENGRIANVDLARRVNMSAATCFRHTQRLFDEGYVTSVRAQLAPEKLGRGSLVFMGVVLDRSTPESFAAFEAAVREIPMVIDCHLVAGDFDYFLKIRVEDMAEFNRLHAQRLIALPAVRQTRTFFVMREVIDNAPLSI
ncbi:MAG: Lrp/AsnC ligand binding domain-containing protein [Rhodospirillaceae bacterium]|jgi:Lrp/AsnC family leucine-responsive transcriptional regulator|nr:Lrp/AsnC ligand binding domain-containing protein [Rhodospirillaceae bacterium]